MHTIALVVISLGIAVSGNDIGLLKQEFKEGYDIFLKTGVQTEKFHNIVARHALSDEEDRQPRDGMCILCDLAVTTVLDAYEIGMSPEEIRNIVVSLCELFNVESDRVCEGVVDSQMVSLLYILQHGENVNTHRICGIVFQAHKCGKDDPSLDWSVDLGDESKTDNLLSTAQPLGKAAPLTVLQLTDIHYDPNYRVGGNAECGEPLCCRSDQGDPATPEAASGRWGDYRSCDTPFEVVTDVLAHIQKQHPQIDYVYMTGDLVDHAVWATSTEKNNATFIKILAEFKRSFGDTPIYPAIGNHEIHPLNVYAPVKVTQENVSSAWLYETLADLWSVWLPEHTKETILKGGYYTVLVKPGFRVVALNNNQCYVYNWWLIFDDKDPDNQLQWLVGVLRQAELDGEKVHLLYHIPVGSSDCYKRWSREFNRIINRFEKTVTGQFSGHTHNDEFHIFYSNEEPSRAINVLYNGGSLTSYSNLNSNYRVYSVDADTLDILDHETWIFNMTASNLSPADTLTWEKMYSFREAYGVASLSPEETDRLAQRMANDENLLQQYFRFNSLHSDPKLDKGCDTKCLQKLLCGVVSTDSSNTSHCDELLAAFRAKNLS